MLLWRLAFGCLCVTSIVGMILFFGYTFRVRIVYPLVMVTTHLLLAILTTGLFVVAVVQRFLSPRELSTLYMVLLGLNLIIIVVTVVVGIVFFLRFNVKGREVYGTFVGLHVTMASVAFIFATASTIAITQTIPPKVPITSPTLYNFYKYHHQHHTVEKTNP